MVNYSHRFSNMSDIKFILWGSRYIHLWFINIPLSNMQHLPIFHLGKSVSLLSVHIQSSGSRDGFMWSGQSYRAPGLEGLVPDLMFCYLHFESLVSIWTSGGFWGKVGLHREAPVPLHRKRGSTVPGCSTESEC